MEEKINKGSDYTFNQIEAFAVANEFEIDQFGDEIIGKHLIVLENEKSTILSFVYTGYIQSKGGLFTCVYSDLK